MRKVYFIVVCLFLSACLIAQLPVINLPNDTILCGSGVLSSGTNGTGYLWSNNATLYMASKDVRL
jgi:hypothetical protein